MNENNPFFIRMRLLEIAKEILMEKYHADRANYDMMFEDLKSKGKSESYEFLGRPPTVDEVMHSAEKLNNFVSNGTSKPRGAR